MPAPPAAKPALALLCAAPLALLALGCGAAVSTSAFKGRQHEAAQAIADLQSDATAGDEKKICADDLAAGVVSALGGRKGCARTVKRQLEEVDNLEVSVQSIQVAGTTATAKVKSTYAGRSRRGSLALVEEGGRWKVAKVLG